MTPAGSCTHQDGNSVFPVLLIWVAFAFLHQVLDDVHIASFRRPHEHGYAVLVRPSGIRPLGKQVVENLLVAYISCPGEGGPGHIVSGIDILPFF